MRVVMLRFGGEERRDNKSREPRQGRSFIIPKTPSSPSIVPSQLVNNIALEEVLIVNKTST
jgi:hypothetical protein